MAEIKPEKLLGAENGFDMREPFNENIEDKFYQLGKNIGKRLWESRSSTQGPKIVVGSDTRFGSSELKKKLIDGLREYSPCIIDFGENLPTPLAYVGFELGQADCLAFVTSSHSPNFWTGIKINFREENDPKQSEQSLEKFEGFCHQDGIWDFYKMFLMEKFAGLRPLKVAVDPLWGSYAGYAPEIFRSLGQIVISNQYLHNQKNGFFPGLVDNSPDPHKEKNLENLVETVKRGKLDLGIAFDGDGDRVKFVDDTGRIISEDEITALLAEYFIKSHKEKYGDSSKPKIIAEIKSSRLVEDTVKELGGELVREQTGRIYIKKHLAKDPEIIFGGELSGHYFYRKNFCGEPFYFVDTGEDGLFTALLVEKILCQRKVKLSALVRPNPYLATGEIRYTYRKGEPLDQVKTEIGQILGFLEDSYRNDSDYLYQKIGDDQRVESRPSSQNKSSAYGSAVFRSSKNDPQKFTFVFEAENAEKLRGVQEDFLGRLGKGNYLLLKKGLEGKFSGQEDQKNPGQI